MNSEELSTFVSAIRENRLLEGADFTQLENLVSRCQEPTELARELMERGSLTRYQTELLFQGEGKRLVLGQYILLEPIGEGGMGQVFKAKHSRMKRVVALKIIRKDVAAGSMALQRFTQEIEAAAQLTHPNVVLAYDANEVDNILFFVMEFVEGIDLGKLVQRFGKPPLGNACDYICQAARGLKHAHEKGLIHRDIKPSNLLLSFSDSMVKILDMGLARLREKSEDPARHLTFTGMVMGTPDFISPEQAKDSRTADHRSDLYSLGCTFYYLLAGRVPFHEGSFTEKLLKHSLEEPTPIEELCPELPGEVAKIVKHLMVKRPDDRYQAATELIKDLEPFATPARSAEQFRPPKEAESEAPVRRPLVSQTDVTLQRPGEDLARKALQPHFDTGTAPLPQPRQAADNSKWATLPVTKMPGTDGSSASSVPVATNKPPRSSVGHGLGAIAAGLGLALLAFVGWKAATGGFGPSVAVGTQATIRDTANSKTTETSPKVTPPDTQTKPPDSAKVQPPETKKEPVEKKVVLPTGRIVDIPKKDLRAKDFPMRAAFSPGGRWLAAGWNDTLRIWDLDIAKPGNADFVQPDFPLSAVSIADDGRVLLGTTEEIRQKGKVPRPVPVLALWEPKGLDLPVTIGRHDGEVSCVAFSPQGNRAISGSDDRTVRLWELRTSKELKVLRKHDTRVNAVAISPDGRRALSGGRDSKVILWDLEAGTDLQTFTGHDSFVTCVVFSPDGKYAVSGSYDRKLILWDLEKREKVRVYTDHTRTITSVAFTPDGKRFVSGSDDLRLYVWSIHAPEFLAMFDDHRLPIIAVGVSADGRYALSVGDDHTVRRWVLPPANP